MEKLWIIADDFTGALDTGVQFAARGASVRVLPWGDPPEDGADAQVLVIDSESRHLSPEAARRITAYAWYTLCREHFGWLSQ